MQAFIDLQRKMRYNVLEVITMEKTMTLNLRVNPTVKQQAEDVLKQLGIRWQQLLICTCARLP